MCMPIEGLSSKFGGPGTPKELYLQDVSENTDTLVFGFCGTSCRYVCMSRHMFGARDERKIYGNLFDSSMLSFIRSYKRTKEKRRHCNFKLQ